MRFNELIYGFEPVYSPPSLTHFKLNLKNYKYFNFFIMLVFFS